MNLALKRDFVHLRASELPKEVGKTVLGILMSVQVNISCASFTSRYAFKNTSPLFEYLLLQTGRNCRENETRTVLYNVAN